MAIAIDHKLEKGAEYKRGYIYAIDKDNPISLAGYKGRMHVRSDIDSETTLLELGDTGPARIIIEANGVTGLVELYIGATVTQGIDWTAGVYDLELYDPNDDDKVIRLMQGRVRVTKEVTR